MGSTSPSKIHLLSSVVPFASFDFFVGHFKMSERKDDMGAVAHQVSNTDDDMRKTGNVKEANVASVALGESTKQHSSDMLSTC